MEIGVAEAARALEVTEETIRRWVRQGKLPSRRQGRRSTLCLETLRSWASDHHLTLREPNPAREDRREKRPLLLEAVQRGGVIFGLGAGDKPEVLRAAVERMPMPTGLDRDGFLARVLERERLASTGLGKGVAIPHPRSPLAGVDFEPAITTCFLESEVDFESVDGRPVFLLLFMLMPSVAVHLKLLSELSFCILRDDIVASVRACRSEREYFETIRRAGQWLAERKKAVPGS